MSRRICTVGDESAAKRASCRADSLGRGLEPLPTRCPKGETGFLPAMAMREHYLNSSTLSNGCVAHGRYRLSVNLVLSPGFTLTNK